MHGEDFSHGHAECNIFRHGKAHGLFGLQFSGQQNGATKQCESESSLGGDTDYILIIFMALQSCKVGIHVAIQTFLKVGDALQSFCSSGHHLVQHPLDCWTKAISFCKSGEKEGVR
jgi:hypothetical protein